MRASDILDDLSKLSDFELERLIYHLGSDKKDFFDIDVLVKTKKERERRKIASNSLLDFTLYTKEDYVVSWHHKLLADTLEEFLDFNSGLDRLIIQIGPRTGKSELVSRRMPAYVFGKMPDTPIIATTYGSELAQRVNRDVQRIIDTDKYRELFPKTTLNKSNVKTSSKGSYIRTSSLFEIVNHKGSFRTAGVGEGITGMGGRILIGDDLFKDWAESQSATRRQVIWDWYTSTFLTRLTPDGKVVMMMTRWHCLHPDQEINTPNGLIKIKDLKHHSEVLTMNGVEEAGLCLSKKVKEEMFEIQTYGNPDPIKVTKDHLLMTQRGWIKAKNLTKEDKLISPIFDSNIMTNNEIISLIDKFDRSYIINKKEKLNNNKKNKICVGLLQQYLLEGKTYKEIATIFGLKNKQDIYSYTHGLGLSKLKTNNIIDENILLNKDFWKIVGLWVAEGSVTNSGKNKKTSIVCWALHKKEIHYKKLIEDTLKINVVEIYRKNTNSLQLKVSCLQLADFLDKNFGLGAENKKCPFWLTQLPKEYRISFLEGYFEGDGCYDKNGLIRGTSISKNLMYGIRNILSSLNVPSLIREEKKKGKCYVVGRMCNINRKFSIAFWSQYLQLSSPYTSNVKDSLQRVKIANNNIEYKIRSIISYEYDGLVYDILNTKSHTFLTEGLVVHNCDDVLGRIIANANKGKGKKWEIISLPMEFEVDRDDIHPLDPRTEEGELLWPDYFNREKVEEIKHDVGSRVFISLYQQRPSPDGGSIFKRDWFKYYRELPTLDYIIISMDSTFSKSDTSDYVVIGAIGVSGGKKFLLHIERERLAFNDSINKLISVIKKYPNASELVIEKKANGDAIIDELKLIPQITIPIFAYSPSTSKESRATSISPQVEFGDVLLPDPQYEGHWDIEWVEPFLKEITEFPSGKYDDQVDMFTQALIRIRTSAALWLEQLANEQEKPSPETEREEFVKKIFGFDEGNYNNGIKLGF